MTVLGIIIARAGSKGVPDKCVRALLDRPVIEYTFEHAKANHRLSSVVLTTDSQKAKELARAAGIEVVDRPAELASDTATVDAAARHAVEVWEQRHRTPVEVVVLLYGNIPVRAEGLIDRAVEHLISSGADSVRSVALLTKQHPDWIHRLDGDRMVQFRKNSIYRRQDLEPLYYHDGAVVAVTRDALFDALRTTEDHQSFLGKDRRAIIQRCDDAVDIDGPIDFHLAEAILRVRKTPNTTAQYESNRAPTAKAMGHPQFVAEAISIAGRRIGIGERVFVVAEAGVNHDGSVETALRLVDAAAAAGADAVKFQMFRAEDIASASAPMAKYQRKACHEVTQRDMLRKLELSFDQFARLKRHCLERGLIFLATPFGVKEVEALAELGAAVIKIASTDITNIRLLDAAARTSLPLIISTGASNEEEIRACVERLRNRGVGGRLILLHCVSCYPTPIEATNLRAVRALQDSFGVPSGLSDHTVSIDVGAWAVAAGACVLEKHLTLDRSQSGPDHAMSLDPSQFADYLRRVRGAEAALGTGALGMNPIEADVRFMARRGVVAAMNISPGTRISENMLTLKRPGTGIPANEIDQIIGRVAAADIAADTLLSWDMLR